jgi:hypothetical protein
MNHRLYSPDLAPIDFHLFRPMKVYLGGQKIQAGNELKYSVMTWLHSQDKTFYAASMSNLQG